MPDMTARGCAYRIYARQKKLERSLKMTEYMAYPRSVYAKFELVNGKRTLAKYLKYRKKSKCRGIPQALLHQSRPPRPESPPPRKRIG